MDNIKFTVPFSKRIFMFLCITLLSLVIGTVMVAMVIGDGSAPRLRIATVIQDVIMFILPAIALAVMICRVPARFLMIDRAPSGIETVLTLLCLIFSIPAMNLIVAWNENLSLPESMQPIETWMRMSEQNAQAAIEVLINGTSIGSLVIAILVVGILAGLSEEMFFRGALQRLLVTGTWNRHLAVWFAAFIFSAVHMQFFGFIPRLLLGAFFGYTALWTGNLWIPVIAHAFNNSLVAIAMWLRQTQTLKVDVDTIGTEPSHGILVGLSIILTFVAVRILYRMTVLRRINQTSYD